MTTALVTGATAGIGREFAVQLATRGDDLVLVARDVARLEALADELRAAHGVEVEVLPADLSDREQTARVAERVASNERPVDVLVNNAGYSLKKRFLDNDVADEEALFDVLARAVLVLSHAAGNTMRSRGRGAIVNVSSVASFMTSGTYSATKSFVTVFTEGLAAELRGTGVTATALCPGFTRTEFHERADVDMSRLPDLAWLDAPRVVRDALADVDRGKVVSVPGRRYKVAVAALRLLPRPLVRAQSRSAHRPSAD
ncbi:SDR family NAD(P)-dependent oxidoreductase [Knoellia aerolata]|uniref:Short-chain dehydrogenase n=1 Tax=Knoellia aerolata DSM 18566 TaxID=1385519 RepID=A0A0A0JZR7_9MICO|nr:SDR family oxidoreductase [Knoellia aerolata]KGN41552.1 short-chain dehydrogenase [Knoellia aerolata DSM 18566]